MVQGDRIIRLEWAVLEGRRPLALGRERAPAAAWCRRHCAAVPPDN